MRDDRVTAALRRKGAMIQKDQWRGEHCPMHCRTQPQPFDSTFSAKRIPSPTAVPGGTCLHANTASLSL